ncbi:hypothetical protein QAD02_008039 [Eretmocerus hayati]|uniref:Uncharacterized protein n=1 Tax=Eretmocerus hayati TaxID=131215 RepID=A0ACC2N5D3_9HYME|nr:hypothetical protein QAD02_008039 [Eretmocerus hayati]
MDGEMKTDGKEMDKDDYMSKGLASIMKGIQNLEKNIVKGLNLGDDDLKGNLGRWIEEILGIEGQVIKAWRVKGKDEAIMISAECESETMKKEVMMNKSKLKGSEIYIENDMTCHQREVRRKLKEKANEARSQSKKATVKGEMLIIDSQVYKWNEMERKIFHTKREWKERK